MKHICFVLIAALEFFSAAIFAQKAGFSVGFLPFLPRNGAFSAEIFVAQSRSLGLRAAFIEHSEAADFSKKPSRAEFPEQRLTQINIETRALENEPRWFAPTASTEKALEPLAERSAKSTFRAVAFFQNEVGKKRVRLAFGPGLGLGRHVWMLASDQFLYKTEPTEYWINAQNPPTENILEKRRTTQIRTAAESSKWIFSVHFDAAARVVFGQKVFFETRAGLSATPILPYKTPRPPQPVRGFGAVFSVAAGAFFGLKRL